jgi:hypothetical protein
MYVMSHEVLGGIDSFLSTHNNQFTFYGGVFQYLF